MNNAISARKVASENHKETDSFYVIPKFKKTLLKRTNLCTTTFRQEGKKRSVGQPQCRVLNKAPRSHRIVKNNTENSYKCKIMKYSYSFVLHPSRNQETGIYTAISLPEPKLKQTRLKCK